MWQIVHLYNRISYVSCRDHTIKHPLGGSEAECGTKSRPEHGVPLGATLLDTASPAPVRGRQKTPGPAQEQSLQEPNMCSKPLNADLDEAGETCGINVGRYIECGVGHGQPEGGLVNCHPLEITSNEKSANIW